MSWPIRAAGKIWRGEFMLVNFFATNPETEEQDYVGSIALRGDDYEISAIDEGKSEMLEDIALEQFIDPDEDEGRVGIEDDAERWMELAPVFYGGSQLRAILDEEEEGEALGEAAHDCAWSELGADDRAQALRVWATRDDAEFKESEHPRDKSGKFGAKGSGEAAKEEVKALPAEGTSASCLEPPCKAPVEKRKREITYHYTPENLVKSQALVSDYKKNVWPGAWQQFQDATKGLGLATGRVKNPESLAEKTTRKGWQSPTESKDVIGERLETEHIDQMYAAVKRLQAKFGIPDSAVDDKVAKPQGFYRAIHLEVNYGGEPPKYGEIQVRTNAMGQVAHWAHDIAYKGPFSKDKAVQDYAVAIGQAVYERDLGQRSDLPAPPPELTKLGLQFDPKKTYEDDWVFSERPDLDKLFEKKKVADERYTMDEGDDEEKDALTEDDYDALPGKFRLIGEDTFVWPPEEFIVGDYDTKAEAFEEAEKRKDPGSVFRVYDENGVRQRKGD